MDGWMDGWMDKIEKLLLKSEGIPIGIAHIF